MGRRSRLAGRFGRQSESARPARCLCGAYSCACRQIQLAQKIRWQISFPAKKSAVLHLIFSYSYSFFCAPVFWIFIRTETEPQLTLRDSVPAILRSSAQKRQAESFAETHGTYLPSQEKGNRTVTSAA